MLRLIGSVTGLALLMVACGGGRGGDSGPPPPSATYSVGGTVTGLAGSGLVLTSDFGGDLAVSASGSFMFNIQLLNGSTFNVGVKTQPASSPPQFCQTANGTGTVAAANVTSVSVTCANGFTVGGTVSGLVGSGLVLAICRPRGGGSGYGAQYFCSSPLQVSANGAFTLGGVFPAMYSGPKFVRITQQPSSPTQPCVVGNSQILIQSANDTNVTVACSEFSYVTNAADNTLSAYEVDATTGALVTLGTPVATGRSPGAVVGTTDRQFAFVGNGGSNDVSAFAVNDVTGALTAVPGSPFSSGTNPRALTLYGNTHFLYVANAGSDTVSAFAVDYSTGGLIPLSPATYTTGKGPSSMAADPAYGSPYLFVANSAGSNDISVFVIDQGTGSLTPVAGSPFPAGGNPISLAFGAGGKFLYTANPGGMQSSISGFSVDLASGALSPLTGSPFALPVSHYIATDQTGAYLYVTSGASVIGYGIDATTGALTALHGFPVGAGANAYSVTIDPTNQFLYVANDGAANITGFRLDASTGALTLMPDSPFPAGNRPDFLATF
jgi:6-phosphogluconolactonase (cycloisomerase 2 family)